jgi:hypothetical protein
LTSDIGNSRFLNNIETVDGEEGIIGKTRVLKPGELHGCGSGWSIVNLYGCHEGLIT